MPSWIWKWTWKVLTEVVWFLSAHRAVNRVVRRMFPLAHKWLYSRYEWEIGQRFNDPPDEYYLSWPDFWASVR